MQTQITKFGTGGERTQPFEKMNHTRLEKVNMYFDINRWNYADFTSQ
jgi:hypothetical protein